MFSNRFKQSVFFLTLLTLLVQYGSCDFDTYNNIQLKPGELANLLSKATTKCPDKFVKYRNKCYYFGVLRVSWNDAKKHCNAMGAERVALETYDEDMFVSEYAIKLQSLHRLFYPRNINGPYNGRYFGFWTDGVNGGKGSTSWRWATSGKGIEYTRWHNTEPNEWRQGTAAIKLYRWIITDNTNEHAEFAWHDNLIAKPMGIICEMKTLTS